MLLQNTHAGFEHISLQLSVFGTSTKCLYHKLVGLIRIFHLGEQEFHGELKFNTWKFHTFHWQGSINDQKEK